MYYKDEVNELMEKMTNKNFAKYLMSIRSLIARLEDKGIEDEELNDKFGILVEALDKYMAGETSEKRNAARAFTAITSDVENKYELVQKGSLQGTSIAIFMGAGVAIGAALSTTIGPAFMGVGIAIGAGLGVAIGAAQEKKAEQEGKLY